jgi:hypothetical protein
MPIPDFAESDDLPIGVHQASVAEVVARFGQSTLQRQLVTKRLLKIYELAYQTGAVERFIIYGSYVTAKPFPNDVDIFLVMSDDFRVDDLDESRKILFNHMRSHNEFGASIFWVRADAILLETVDEMIAYWQTTRNNSKRGIIEIINE